MGNSDPHLTILREFTTIIPLGKTERGTWVFHTSSTATEVRFHLSARMEREMVKLIVLAAGRLGDRG
tara:strand:- start:2166 stop:2366 length:201 start_codon:yes stop_codon:yes gene_type:complete